MTRCEKLRNRIGQKEPCEYCLKKKRFDTRWMFTTDRKIAYPECVIELKKQGKGMISI